MLSTDSQAIKIILIFWSLPDTSEYGSIIESFNTPQKWATFYSYVSMLFTKKVQYRPRKRLESGTDPTAECSAIVYAKMCHSSKNSLNGGRKLEEFNLS